MIGSAVYDEIDEMSRGKLADRKVKLHHSTGTKHQKEGHDVLQLEFAGSGGHDVLKKHKDRNGGIDDINNMTKQEAETKRLELENKFLKLFSDTAKKCSDTLKLLDKTRVGKSTSSSYDDFHRVLEEGTKLGAHTSVNEMSDFLQRFTDISERYRSSHDALIGPITKDGETRLRTSEKMKALGSDTAEELTKLTKGLGEKNTPIGLRIMDSSAKLADIQNKQEQRKAAEAPPAVEPADPAIQPAAFA